MKMFLKAAASVLALTLTLCMTACAGSGSGNSPVDGQSSAASSQTGSSAEESSEAQSSLEESSQTQSSLEESSEPQSSLEESSQPQSLSEESSQPQSSAEESSAPESSVQESSAQEQSKPTEQSKPSETSKPTEQSKPTETSKPSETSKQESSEPPKPIEIQSITLSDSSITMYEGSTYRLRFTVTPSNADQTGMTWHWGDNKIIDVKSDGTITAKKIGKDTITITTRNEKSAKCEVNVVKHPPEPTHEDPPEITGPAVDSSWFDDAVFVGDSVTGCLASYAYNGSLGDAYFLYSVGLGYHNSLWDLNYRNAVHPTVKGRKVTVDEGIRILGKKKVFIMFGMNDLGYGVDSTIEAMTKLIDRILAKSPDVQIYIQSMTPLLSTIHRNDGLTNENIVKYNKKAREYCLQKGFIYVDVASAVRDSSGCLIYKYCIDPNYMGLHLSPAGCEQWVNYLKRHVSK